MNRKQQIFALVVSLAAAAALMDCAFVARLTLLRPRGAQDLVMWGFLLLLTVFLRSMRLPLRGGDALRLSFSAALCATLVVGNEIAILLYALSTPLCFFYDPADRRYHSAIHFPALRLIFNTSSMVLALYGARFAMSQGRAFLSSFVFPDSLLPLLIFGLVALVITFLLTVIVQALEGNRVAGIARRPSAQLAGILLGLPVGLFMAWLITQPTSLGGLVPVGMVILVLSLLPLPFLRHALALRLENDRTFVRLIEGIADSLEEDDPYLRGHSRHVRDLALRIAYSMGLPPSRMKELETAALLHDVGKACIDESILNKKGALTPEEAEQVRAHSLLGAQMMEGLPLPPVVFEVLRSHHERYDGMGYPRGVRLSELPTEVSIVSVAEAYDAMTSERPFRKAMSKDRALSVLIEESGRQFSPEVVYALQQGALSEEPS